MIHVMTQQYAPTYNKAINKPRLIGGIRNSPSILNSKLTTSNGQNTTVRISSLWLLKK